MAIHKREYIAYVYSSCVTGATGGNYNTPVAAQERSRRHMVYPGLRDSKMRYPGAPITILCGASADHNPPRAKSIAHY
jgi:hypothetical protein